MHLEAYWFIRFEIRYVYQYTPFTTFLNFARQTLVVEKPHPPVDQ